MELKSIDKKILAHLSENARDSFTKIAKELKLSREQVEYRIKKFYSSGIIKQIPAVPNYGALGYSDLKVVLVKLVNPELTNKIISKLQGDSNCFSSGRVFNKYDLYVNVIFRDENEARQKIAELFSTPDVSHYKIIQPFFSELYPLKIIDNKEPIKFMPEFEKIKLDSKDLKMLKILSKDSRVKLIDIANELKISAELALHRLKKLYSKGVIQGYRIHFDYSKFERFFSIILLDLKDISDKTLDKIKKYARNSEIVSSASLCLGSPNAFIQIFHENEKELREEILKLKKLFGEKLIKIDTLFIEGEEKFNFLPFIN